MNAQTTFYTLASIYYVLGIFLMIAGIAFIIFLFVMLRKAEHSIRKYKAKAERELSKLVEEQESSGIIPLVFTGIRWFMKRRQK